MNSLREQSALRLISTKLTSGYLFISEWNLKHSETLFCSFFSAKQKKYILDYPDETQNKNNLVSLVD